MNQGIEGIDFISEEDRLRTNTMFSAPNMFYVYYDNNNNIYSITNEKKESGNFVETTEALVKDFLEGKKDYKNFKVKGSRNKQFVENTVHVKSVYKDFSVITACETTPELAVSIKDKKIVFKINPDITGYSGNLQFFIVDKNDYNWLFETLEVSLEDIQLHGIVEKSLNYNFENIAILTKNFFNSYGIVND